MANEFQMRVNAEGVVSLLRSNLIDRYKDCFCIIQELLQNADDAKASRVHFGISEGLNVEHPLGRLPALFIINDGPVSPSNLSSIYTIAAGDKGNEKDKIGKFGLGMKSVFHVCEGFFMFGNALDSELEFPYFCTPWTEEYHEDWYVGWNAAKQLMDKAVRERIKDIVTDWDRWFCVWLPLRSESLHAGNQTRPIIQMYPTDADLDDFTGLENASRAAHMLPLLRHVAHLSFADRHGALRKFILDGTARMTGRTGRFSGNVQVEGQGPVPFRYSGVEKKIEDGEFAHLKSLRCWPENTRFVRGEGLKSFPDKTDSHVALCFLSEASESPSLTISPCVYLPLSDVRDDRPKYTKFEIGGKNTVTIDLHGSLFVDAGRQAFSISQPLGRDPITETELRAEWNRRIYEDGILPQIVPELYSILQEWDEETANAVMGAINEVPFFKRWVANACRTEGLALELKSDGYKWSRIGSEDAVFAIDPPRSPIVRKVIVAALPNDAHIIDASAGKLLKPGVVKPEFTPEICVLMLRAIVALDPKESDNEVLRQFAQTCAAKLDFESLGNELRSAPIWKASDGRYSYNELLELLKKHRLYCHAEGDLRKIFLAAAECSPIQVNEPLAKALGLDVPDFTYDFVLDVLQDGPKLRDVDSRRQLLERLLHINHQHGDPKWVKVCRYLVHGEMRLLECTEPLFMPVDGDYHEFSEKIVDVLSRHKYGTPCKVPRTITEILDRPRQAELNLPLSTAEGLVCALAEVGDLTNDGFLADDWRQLVMMVQNLSEQPNVANALRNIPIYPTESGQFAALTGFSYYEGDYSIAPQLRPFVRILKIDGDERLMGRMRRLANKWNPNACIETANKYITDAVDFASIVVDALNATEYINNSVADILRNKEWVCMIDGRYLSPISILKLPCVSGMVPGCDTISEVADSAAAKAISKHGLLLGQQSSVDRLVDAMANVPDGIFSLGEFKDGSGSQIHIEIDDLFNVFPENIDETLPAMGVLRRLRNNHVVFKDRLPKLMNRLPIEAMVSVLSVLTDRIDDDSNGIATCWNFLVHYLNEAARRTDFITSIMPRLRFRNRNGSLKNPGDLCVGVSGVPDRFILDDKYLCATDFLNCIEATANSRKSEGREKQTTLREYFSGWPTEFDDRIGGFIACCTDQPDELELVKSRYGFGSRNIAESRNSIVNSLNTYLANQHCYVLATPDEQINVIAINGDVMSVTVTPLTSASDLFCGQFNTCELVKNTALWYLGTPPMPDEAQSLILRLRKLDFGMSSSLSPEKLDELLANTLSSIIQVYGFAGSNVEAYWESLKNVEQLDVRVTKSVILQSLDMYLPQIRCKNQKLKEAFKKSSQLQYGEEQARQNGDRQQEAAYREERMELHRQLETMITQDIGLQDSILDALRDRVRGFSYNIDSILFELFQNADDACEEMYQMCDGVTINMPNRFDVRFDGHNLIVAHWGRPINRAKVGSEANPKFDEYRVDLQKMILLSQSGKEIEGVQTKGLYGLGFKSVFLVCDTPCVLSGKLRFKIVSGLLPEPLDETEDSMVRDFTREFEDVPSGVKPTVFILPIRKDVRDEVSKAVHHFAHEIDVLGIFSRRIRKIVVREANNSVTEIDLSGESDTFDGARTCGVNGDYFRIDTDEATLLTAAKDGFPAPLKPDVATYWATCPTSVKAGLGVAINANLKLDTGRLFLDPKSVKNGELLSRTANALYEKLSNWIKSIPEDSRYAALSALFFAFTGGETYANWDSSHADAKAMIDVLWGNGGAYRRLLETFAAVPSGLAGEYRRLCVLNDIEWMVDKDIMTSGLIGTIDTFRFKPGNVVAKERFWNVGQVFFPDVIRRIPSYDIVRLLSDLATQNVVLPPLWCNANAERLCALIKPQMDRQDIRDILRGFEFETLIGTGCKASKLLIVDDDDEQGRANFLPGTSVLSHEYGSEARKLVKLFRCEDYMSADELANFALTAATKEQRVALLRYLAEGQHTEAFLKVLRDKSDSSWLKDWQTYFDEGSLGIRGKTKVMLALSRRDDDSVFLEQMKLCLSLSPEFVRSTDDSLLQSTQVSELPSFSDVRNWWSENGAEWIEKYNDEAYGRSTVEPLTFDIQTKEARSAWMEVLLLGAAHRMGFKLCQHKGFIGFLKRKRWWDEYCEHEVSPKRWMETLDQCLEEEEFSRGEYRYWFSLFLRIYQFAKHLETYVQLFETWNDAEDCKKCDLAAIKENSKLRGTGIDAPGLQYALGQGTGLAFVYREMVRRGAIRNPLLHRFCFVPYPSVSEFGLCIRDSEAIFDKAVHEIGREDATFGLAFDIAITSYIRSGR
ncbi:MAG: hypothetical protein PUJ80_03595 [Verrucomicrobiota bacterium]|nr:hypothetical protein [Verrucomicrobiota bacterium]